MNQVEAAEALGKSVRTLCRWLSEPEFPQPVDGEYDLDAIREWEILYKQPADSLDSISESQVRIKAAEARKKEGEADRIQRLEAMASGNLLLRDKYERHLAYVIEFTRSRFTQLPRKIAPSIPAAIRAELVQEITRYIVITLDECARMFCDGPDLDEPD